MRALSPCASGAASTAGEEGEDPAAEVALLKKALVGALCSHAEQVLGVAVAQRDVAAEAVRACCFLLCVSFTDPVCSSTGSFINVLCGSHLVWCVVWVGWLRWMEQACHFPGFCKDPLTRC